MLSISHFKRLFNGPEAAIAGTQDLPQAVFLHVPKTGGTTFNLMVKNSYPAHRAVHLLNLWEGKTPDKSQYDFLSGHFRWSFVKEQGLDQRHLITFVREPLARAVSQFYFMKMDEVLGFYETDREIFADSTKSGMIKALHKARQFSLEEFLREEPDLSHALLGNFHTWILSEGGGRIADLGTADLAVAKSVLDRCFFVGVCEKMDESMALIARKMGWPDRPSHRENATSGKRETNDHSPWVINRLKEINALDLDLYQYALGTFAQLKTDPSVGHFPRPDASGFTPKLSILGSGWHPRELHQQEWFCWTGPEDKAHLSLKSDIRTMANITLHFRKPFRPETTTQMALSLNGTLLDHHILGSFGRMALRARVSEAFMQKANGRIDLTIHTGPTHKISDVVPGNADPRRVGVCLLRVDLAAVSPFWG